MPDLIPAQGPVPASRDGRPARRLYEMAQRLRDAVTTTFRYNARWSVLHWAKELQILERGLGGDRERLRRAFDWFLANIRWRYCPQARSAAGFREKFLAIEAAMARKAEDDAKTVAADVAVGKDAAFVVEQLEGRSWPKGAERLLPAVAQQSLDNLRAFCRRFRQAKDLPRSVENAWRSVEDGIGDAVDYLVKWFRDVNDRVRRWPNWSGDMGMWVWRPDHADFARAATGWISRDYQTTGADLWKQLLLRGAGQ